MYYSDYFPIEEGARHTVSMPLADDGPEVKVFIKCYDELSGPYRIGVGEERMSPKNRIDLARINTPPKHRAAKSIEASKTSRAAEHWNIHTEDFTPKHAKYSPKWGHVMLYAYQGAGQVDFDDVVVKQIVPPKKENRDN